MSGKATCPACQAHLSAIADIVALRYPGTETGCPTCGLTPDAIRAVYLARSTSADKALREHYESLVIRCGRAEAAEAWLRSIVHGIRIAMKDAPNDGWGVPNQAPPTPPWRGDRFHFQASAQPRLTTAVLRYAAELGMEAEDTGSGWFDIITGQPELYAKADRVAAYARGFMEALADDEAGA